jgi:hypothetical protein
VNSIAKLRGYMVERTETRTGPLDALSAQQLEAMVRFAEVLQEKQKVIDVRPEGEA